MSKIAVDSKDVKKYSLQDIYTLKDLRQAIDDPSPPHTANLRRRISALQRRELLDENEIEALSKLIDIRFHLRQMGRKYRGAERVSHLLKLFPELTDWEVNFLFGHLINEVKKSYTTSFTLLFKQILPLLSERDITGMDQVFKTWITEVVCYIGRTQSSKNEKDILKKLLAGDQKEQIGEWVSHAIERVITRDNFGRFRDFQEFISLEQIERLSIRLGRYAHIRSYEQGLAYIDHATIVRKNDLERNINRLLEMSVLDQKQAAHLMSLLHVRYAINRLKNWWDLPTHRRIVLEFLGRGRSDADVSFLIRHLNNAMASKYPSCFSELIDKLIDEEQAGRIYIGIGTIKFWLNALITHVNQAKGSDGEVDLVRRMIDGYGIEELTDWIKEKIDMLEPSRYPVRISGIKAYLRMIIEDEDFAERTATIESQIRTKADARGDADGKPVERPYTTAEKTLAEKVAQSLLEILNEETAAFQVPWEMIRNRLEGIEEKNPKVDMDRAIELTGYKEELDRRKVAGEEESSKDYLIQAPDYDAWNYQEQFYRATSNIGGGTPWGDDD